MTFKDDGKFFTGAKNTPEINSHVRYIVLHKCRWTAKQDNLYGPFLNKAYECEDTSFVQVNNTLLIGFILSEVTQWYQNLFNVAFEFLLSSSAGPKHFLCLIKLFKILSFGKRSKIQ